MSIIDIDPHSEDRGHPMPNGHDALLPGSVMAHRTKSVNYITGASDLSQLSGALNGQLTVVKTGVFAWDTAVAFNQPSVDGSVYSGTVLVGTVAHGLGYTPGIIVYENFGNGSIFPLPITDMFATFGAGHSATFTGGVWWTLRAATDSVNVYFYVDLLTIGSGTSLGGDVPIKYYLLQQAPN